MRNDETKSWVEINLMSYKGQKSQKIHIAYFVVVMSSLAMYQIIASSFIHFINFLFVKHSNSLLIKLIKANLKYKKSKNENTINCDLLFFKKCVCQLRNILLKVIDNGRMSECISNHHYFHLFRVSCFDFFCLCNFWMRYHVGDLFECSNDIECLSYVDYLK